MPCWRETATSDPAATALLSEYFDDRAATFPIRGRYSTVFPTPAHFESPNGVFLVVEHDGVDVGCGGIRAIPPGAAGGIRFEVKHLYLRPGTRGLGLGRTLLAELERRAKAFGATELVLDTNDSLVAAGHLYRSSGYESIEPYNDNKNANVWLRKVL